MQWFPEASTITHSYAEQPVKTIRESPRYLHSRNTLAASLLGHRGWSSGDAYISGVLHTGDFPSGGRPHIVLGIIRGFFGVTKCSALNPRQTLMSPQVLLTDGHVALLKASALSHSSRERGRLPTP